MTLAVILAGGRSSRMGRDKAFVELAGRPLIAHALACLRPQATRVVVNSNADAAAFAAYGVEVFADDAPGVEGPLAGIVTALARWPNADLVTVAIDLPFVPHDLVARLRGGDDDICRFAQHDAQHALAVWWAPHSHASLMLYLQSGRRDLRGYLARRGAAVAWTPHNGFNVNTPDDLTRAERMLTSGSPTSLQVNAA